MALDDRSPLERCGAFRRDLGDALRRWRVVVPMVLPAGQVRRPPGKAEREWAARGGRAGEADHPWGDGPPPWAQEYPPEVRAEELRQVAMGSRKPNVVGLP